MPKNVVGLVSAGLAFLVTACRVSSVGPVTFPAAYSPEEPIVASTVDACVAVGTIYVADDRPDRSTVGERSIEAREGRAVISIEGDIEDWLRSGIERAFETAAIRRVDSAPSVTFRLTTLVVDEVAYRNAEYDGRVVLEVSVVGADGEPSSFGASGTAENYGRPGNPANYQETINHALDRAASQAVSNAGFHRRLCAGV